MIQVIYGRKGSGKTKRIIEKANNSVETCDGGIVYLYCNSKHMLELRHEIRYIDTSEYGIKGAYTFLGFVSGLLASNFDLKMIFVDGFLKLMDRPVDQMEDLFAKLDDFSTTHSIDIVLSISLEPSEMPEYLQKYITD